MFNLIRQGSLWFYFKDEATKFNADIWKNNTFTSCEYNTKLLENKVVDGNNAILKNATITSS